MTDTQMRFYDWHGDIYRTIGDIFDGEADLFVPDKGWQQAHFFDVVNGGVPLAPKEALDRMKHAIIEKATLLVSLEADGAAGSSTIKPV